MRRAALFASPLVVLGLYGCTQILSLDDAVIAPADSDSKVVLPIPDGVVAGDSFEEAETKPLEDTSRGD